MLDPDGQRLYAAAQADMLAGCWEAATAKLEELATREQSALRPSADERREPISPPPTGSLARQPNHHRRRRGRWTGLGLTVIGCGLVAYAVLEAATGPAGTDRPLMAEQPTAPDPPVLSAPAPQEPGPPPKLRAGDCVRALTTVQRYKVTAAQIPLNDYLASTLLGAPSSPESIQLVDWNVAEQSGTCVVTFLYWDNNRPVTLAWSVGATGVVQPLDEVTRQKSGMTASGAERGD
ncbi:MAG TPA: hypothetical protein VK066_24280 [Chloroflexota bacterium]|nr:hypothetical protein [Chloroflexota bacterium]